MRVTHKYLPAVAAAFVGIAVSDVSAADGIADLGSIFPPGLRSVARAVSGDGTVVAGFADDGSGTGSNRAFRWTSSGGAVGLPSAFGATSTQARGISADGSVIVGEAKGGSVGSERRAFRWTQDGDVLSLGVLNGGTWSSAAAASADGSVIVGAAADGAAVNADRAVWWGQTGPGTYAIHSLDLLHSGTSSRATGVSGDGSVIVGSAADGAAGNANRAVAWERTGASSYAIRPLDLLSGGTSSAAYGVSADGGAIVGYSEVGTNRATQSVRWMRAGTVENLGTLNNGVVRSVANGVSGDGKVVVGYAADGAAGNLHRGFRWTQATGMQSISQWLTANGVTVGAGLATFVANATNADGSVVVGNLTDGHAFLARVSASGVGVGLMDVAAYNQTLQGTVYLPSQAIAQGELVLHGLHGSPMRGLPRAGQRTFWVGGDWGRQENLTGDGQVGAGEIGVAFGLTEHVQVKAAVGQMHGEQALAFGGKASVRGTYVVPELIAALPGTPLRVSVAGYYSVGDADIQRGYENAGVAVKSGGSPDVETSGARLRLDWLDAVRLGDFGLTPYTSVTHYRTRIDGYTEQGGGFPVRWEARDERSTLGRLGADAAYRLSGDWTLLGRLEAVHRLEARSAGASGTILGLDNTFAFDGAEYERDWLRAAVGAEADLGPGTVSLMLNASTETNGPAYWAYANYRLVF